MKNNKFISFKIFLLMVYLSLFIGCAAPKIIWNSKVLYMREGLGTDWKQEGRSVLLFPIVKKDGFDSSLQLLPENQLKIFSGNKSNLNGCQLSDLEENYKAKYGVEIPKTFFDAIIKYDILKLTTFDSVWASSDCRYALINRIVAGVTIKTFDGKVKKIVEIESELWDTRNYQVVWREKTSGSDMSGSVNDVDFIQDALLNIYMSLPKFIAVDNEENW